MRDEMTSTDDTFN